MCIGYATGAAAKNNEQDTANSFLRLANAIHKKNPHWTPYVVDGEQPSL